MKRRLVVLSFVVLAVFGITSCAGDGYTEVEQKVEDITSDPNTGNDGDGPDTPPPTGD